MTCSCGRATVRRMLGPWCTYCHRSVKRTLRATLQCVLCADEFPRFKKPSPFCPKCRVKGNYLKRSGQLAAVLRERRSA